VALVAVPGRLLGVVPSPQLTLIELTVPSGSEVVKVTVTVCPVRAGFGVTELMFTVGGLSVTVTMAAGLVAVAWVESPL